MDKLTKFLERVNDEEFKSGTAEKETKRDDTENIPLNEDLDWDHTPVTKNNDSCYVKDKISKSKFPPTSKIPIHIAKKKKGIRRES